jgi:hypothetical protein
MFEFESSSMWDLNLSSPMFEFESQQTLNEFMFPLLCFMNTHV